MLLAYGQGYREMDLPAGATIAAGRALPALEEPKNAIHRSLRQPIASQPLASLAGPHSRVAILISDSTRPTGMEIFLPVVLQELSTAGVVADNITILVGTGAHGVLSDIELAKLVPREVKQRFTVISHDCFDQEQLVYVGTTSRGNKVWFNRWAVAADLRILTGAVSIHPFAGFGGGCKALFPGVAGYGTIGRNHALLFAPEAQAGALQGNPVHEDFMEGIAMVGDKFLLNTVVNEQGEIAAVVAGEVAQAHLAGVQVVQDYARTPLLTKADTVVASAGGFPYDINLYQAVKALQNAARVVKPGGRIFLLAACADGIGSDKFAQWAPQRLSSRELSQQLRQQFELGKHKCFFLSQILELADVYLYSDLDDTLVESFGLIPVHDLASLSFADTTVVLPYATATLPQVAD